MTTQAENKLRVRKAAGWILQGHSVSHVVARLAESEGVDYRLGCSVTAPPAWLLVVCAPGSNLSRRAERQGEEWDE